MTRSTRSSLSQLTRSNPHVQAQLGRVHDPDRDQQGTSPLPAPGIGHPADLAHQPGDGFRFCGSDRFAPGIGLEIRGMAPEVEFQSVHVVVGGHLLQHLERHRTDRLPTEIGSRPVPVRRRLAGGPEKSPAVFPLELGTQDRKPVAAVVDIVHAQGGENLDSLFPAVLRYDLQRVRTLFGEFSGRIPKTLSGQVLDQEFGDVAAMGVGANALGGAVEDRVHLGSDDGDGAALQEVLRRDRQVGGKKESIVTVVVEDEAALAPPGFVPELFDLDAGGELVLLRGLLDAGRRSRRRATQERDQKEARRDDAAPETNQTHEFSWQFSHLRLPAVNFLLWVSHCKNPSCLRATGLQEWVSPPQSVVDWA